MSDGDHDAYEAQQDSRNIEELNKDLGHKLKMDRNLPYFQLTLVRYQICENGAWAVGFIVNEGDLILTRKGRILAVPEIWNYITDEEAYTTQLGPIISYAEDEWEYRGGIPDKKSICRDDTPYSIKCVSNSFKIDNTIRKKIETLLDNKDGMTHDTICCLSKLLKD